MSLRIAIVSRIYRPEPSAASLYLGAVADEATARGHDVTVLTARPPGDLDPGSPAETVRTFPVLRDRNGYVRGYLQYLSFDVPLAFRLLVLRRPDVVLMEPPPTTGVIVRVVCWLRRIPYVYDAADIWSDAADQATGSRLVISVLRRMERFGMRGARHLVTISQGVKDRVRAMGVSRPVTVTGFGADTRAFMPSTQPDAPTDRVFLYAGSYSAWHGADAAIEAFAEFSRETPGYIFRFIGNGSERESLETRARELGLEGTVEFVDAVPSEQLLPELHTAVASIATLRPGAGYDYAFTTKAYSSMAAGCPVIFAGPGPTATFLHRANAAVRAGAVCRYEPSEIARAMSVFAADPLTGSARRALAEWTADEHSMEAVARQVVDVLESAAAPGSAA